MLPAILPLLTGCAAPEATDAPDSGLAADSAAAAAPAGPTFLPAAEDGQSVAALDPERYLGVWYEIATTPGFVQQSCTGTTAEYGVVDDDTISVYNRCTLGSLDGPVNEIEGTADFTDDTYARLAVDFGFGFPAPYYVVELDGSEGDAPYSFAAVNSGGFQVWILGRTPTMDRELYRELVDRLDARGLPAERLVRTVQPEE